MVPYRIRLTLIEKVLSCWSDRFSACFWWYVRCLWWCHLILMSSILCVYHWYILTLIEDFYSNLHELFFSAVNVLARIPFSHVALLFSYYDRPVSSLPIFGNYSQFTLKIRFWTFENSTECCFGPENLTEFSSSFHRRSLDDRNQSQG